MLLVNYKNESIYRANLISKSSFARCACLTLHRDSHHVLTEVLATMFGGIHYCCPCFETSYAAIKIFQGWFWEIWGQSVKENFISFGKLSKALNLYDLANYIRNPSTVCGFLQSIPSCGTLYCKHKEPIYRHCSWNHNLTERSAHWTSFQYLSFWGQERRNTVTQPCSQDSTMKPSIHSEQRQTFATWLSTV